MLPALFLGMQQSHGANAMTDSPFLWTWYKTHLKYRV